MRNILLMQPITGRLTMQPTVSTGRGIDTFLFKIDVAPCLDHSTASTVRSGGSAPIISGTVVSMSTDPLSPAHSRPSFPQVLRDTAEAARSANREHPWERTLRKLKGRVGIDGVERIATTDVFDVLEIPMRRRPSETVRLSKLMRSLGWQPIRARGLNPGSYRDRVRGYAREVPGHPARLQKPNDF
ncbi:MAG: hypothetical protein ACJ8F3_11475 [Xanthobacteraceae bacterium]